MSLCILKQNSGQDCRLSGTNNSKVISGYMYIHCQQIFTEFTIGKTKFSSKFIYAYKLKLKTSGCHNTLQINPQIPL